MELNKIIVFGLSHEELSLEEREKLLKSINMLNVKDIFGNKINGYVNLSTCLRIEYYLEEKETVLINYEELKKYFPIFSEKVYIRRGYDAIDYLFKVICGFHSIIKGEDQILSQIKNSFFKAQENKTSSKFLNIIFNKAIELGKKFRTVSNVAHNALSLEAISVNFLKELTNGNLINQRIFVLGIGDLSKSIIEILIKNNIKDISITNRTYHTAQKMSNAYNLKNVDYKLKYQGLSDADIIISATSAPHLVVEKDRFLSVMKDKKYIFLDLAVPRDVDDRLKEKSNISIFNLTDIWEIYNKNINNRDLLMDKYNYLIEEQEKKLLKALEFYN